MSVEENKRAVLRWVDAVNGGEEEEILDQLTEDFIFKTMARSPKWLMSRSTRQEFAASPAAYGALLKQPFKFEVIGMIADGDQVALEAQSDVELKNGKKYDNAYTLIFSFRDGRICEVREYSCSHLVVETFGEFNPNNPQNIAASV